MRVDFYQLGGAPIEEVIARLAQKLLDTGERLLVVASDEAFLARLGAVLSRPEAHVVSFANPLTGGSSANTVYTARR